MERRLQYNEAHARRDGRGGNEWTMWTGSTLRTTENGGMKMKSIHSVAELRVLCALALAWFTAPGARAEEYALPVTVTTDLQYANTPMDPRIDFGAIISANALPGVLDPNSITVVDLESGDEVPCAVSEELAYGDAGRTEWVIRDPSHRRYEIRFRTCEARPPLSPRAYVPQIGTGDLLRYNAGVPRPIALPYPGTLADMTGDGLPDLLGCWNYAYRPGWPWDGIVVYPRAGEGFTFGDMARLRYVNDAADTQPKFFSAIYMQAAFGDANGDGLTDLLYSPRNGTAQFYLNTGRFDGGTLPLFQADATLVRPAGAWGPVQLVDLDRDGALDVTMGAEEGDARRVYFIRNTNANGWPFVSAEAVDLGVAEGSCFFDVDGDATLDAVGLKPEPEQGVHAYSLVWQRGLGGLPPTFAETQPLPGQGLFWPNAVAATPNGLLVECNVYQEVVFLEHVSNDPPYFAAPARAESLSAVMSLSDQAWPCICDWDADGDLDLLIGGGYGWPRIVINEGTRDRAAYTAPQFILSEGKPIRLLRNDVLGAPKHWHNMGYSYPWYADWDSDGFPDLLLPNETNRIFWYRNVGTRTAPAFGPREQIIVDGYGESDELRRQSAERAVDATYPLEEEQPFFWRTGAAFADWNGDGLLDVATHDGATRKLTLFARHRDGEGPLRLKKAGPLHLTDGREIDDAIVERGAHWTERFCPVDWDGDGLLDIVYSCAGTEPAKGSIYLLRNAGSKETPVFEPPRTFTCFGDPIKVTAHGPMAWAGDTDGDGKPDLLTCVEWSVYPFYAHAALAMDARPEYEVGEVKLRD